MVEGGGGQGHAAGVQQRLDVLVEQRAAVGGGVLELAVAGRLAAGAGRGPQEDGVQAALVQHGQVGGVAQAVQHVQHEGAVRQLRVPRRPARQSQAAAGGRAAGAAARPFPRVGLFAGRVASCRTLHQIRRGRLCTPGTQKFVAVDHKLSLFNAHVLIMFVHI